LLIQDIFVIIIIYLKDEWAAVLLRLGCLLQE